MSIDEVKQSASRPTTKVTHAARKSRGFLTAHIFFQSTPSLARRTSRLFSSCVGLTNYLTGLDRFGFQSFVASLKVTEYYNPKILEPMIVGDYRNAVGIDKDQVSLLVCTEGFIGGR